MSHEREGEREERFFVAAIKNAGEGEGCSDFKVERGRRV